MLYGLVMINSNSCPSGHRTYLQEPVRLRRCNVSMNLKLKSEGYVTHLTAKCCSVCRPRFITLVIRAGLPTFIYYKPLKTLKTPRYILCSETFTCAYSFEFYEYIFKCGNILFNQFVLVCTYICIFGGKNQFYKHYLDAFCSLGSEPKPT